MKTAIHLLAAVAMLACNATLLAQAKKKDSALAAAPAESVAAATPAKPVKPLPMNSRVDEIDAAAKTFTQNTRDGRKVKHVVTEKSAINQGATPARFEDIKVGDMVSGLRLKKNTEGTEYEVIKITKFGPKAKSAEKK